VRILITGGAGFVGSNLALLLKRDRPGDAVIALDNLKRRGSELTLPRLKEGGVEFRHGDIRNPDDLADIGPIGLLLECSAEPSVHAGYEGSPAYLVHTNLVGTLNCLEYARRHGADFLFLSTSRVYPIGPLTTLPLVRQGSRFRVEGGRSGEGWSERGITEAFPLGGHRSLYGATKLCSELMIEEYRAAYGLRAIVNRCGVLTGPWQMGKVDQGFVVLWMARHAYGGSLAYTGYGGEGLQVRDILHIQDLYELLHRQLMDIGKHSGKVYNVGGGLDASVSLRELTQYCEEVTGETIKIGVVPHTHPADIPYYVTDHAAVCAATGWKPRHTVPQILSDIHAWLIDYRKMLEGILAS
jgi:CDP-paratose 2-epimerase